jgi:hypothetical protein
MDKITEINVHDVLAAYINNPSPHIIELSEEEILANGLHDNLEKMKMAKLWSIEVEGIWVFMLIKKETHTIIKKFEENKFQPHQMKKEESMSILYLIQMGEAEIEWDNLAKEEGVIGLFASMIVTLLKNDIRILVIDNEYQLKNFINSHY